MASDDMPMKKKPAPMSSDKKPMGKGMPTKKAPAPMGKKPMAKKPAPMKKK